MAPSDLDTLVEMGFERERAELAVKTSGGLQGAIDWLESNQDRSLDEIKASSTSSTTSATNITADHAQSLVCNECGRKFRSHIDAEAHAFKTDHTDFSESAEAVAPLTEEEKKARLAELREKANLKRAAMSEEDKIAHKRNEEIKRKSTKEQQDAKEQLQMKEQVKEAEKKRREKFQEIEAKKKIQAKIAADKEERRRKAEVEKAQREGQPVPLQPLSDIPQPAPTTSKSSSNQTEARLRLQTQSGNIMKTFPAETTLFEVAHAVAQENGTEVQSFAMNFPKKVFMTEDFGMTLREAGLVPSAALIVR